MTIEADDYLSRYVFHMRGTRKVFMSALAKTLGLPIRLGSPLVLHCARRNKLALPQIHPLLSARKEVLMTGMKRLFSVFFPKRRQTVKG